MDDPELLALEVELSRSLAAMPSPEFRLRILRSAARELRAARLVDWSWYVAGVAAMLVLWANLSWTASRETSYDWRPRGDAPASVVRIEKLVPGISPGEARRQALLLGGGARARASKEPRPIERSLRPHRFEAS